MATHQWCQLSFPFHVFILTFLLQFFCYILLSVEWYLKNISCFFPPSFLHHLFPYFASLWHFKKVNCSRHIALGGDQDNRKPRRGKGGRNASFWFQKSGPFQERSELLACIKHLGKKPKWEQRILFRNWREEGISKGEVMWKTTYSLFSWTKCGQVWGIWNRQLMAARTQRVEITLWCLRQWGLQVAFRDLQVPKALLWKTEPLNQRDGCKQVHGEPSNNQGFRGNGPLCGHQHRQMTDVECQKVPANPSASVRFTTCPQPPLWT